MASKYSKKIIFISLLPVNDDLLDPNPWGDEGVFKTLIVDQFNKIIKKTSIDSGCNFINLFEDWRLIDLTNYLADGLHPNSKGHELMFNQIIEAFSGIYQDY